MYFHFTLDFRFVVSLSPHPFGIRTFSNGYIIEKIWVFSRNNDEYKCLIFPPNYSLSFSLFFDKCFYKKNTNIRVSILCVVHSWSRLYYLLIFTGPLLTTGSSYQSRQTLVSFHVRTKFKVQIVLVSFISDTVKS